jgi:hypothetical protein
MQREHTGSALVLGVFILLGLAALGYLLGDAAIRFKAFERSVTVKGLSEQEYPADVVIWPIQFTLADNELAALYASLEDNTARIRSFLLQAGIPAAEITVSAPVITDKSAQSYGGAQQPEFRYSALQTVTVYSGDVERVRGVMSRLVDLGKQGIALTGGDYQNQTEYLFTRLNEVKPAMIEEATGNAREVAQKFAQDSNSRLGKIRQASQGQFTISPRDRNNPHIMKVRVVSTVVYYLSD